MLLVAMYTQGIFNQVVYWPTYTWSIIHVILSVFFISIGTDLKQQDPAWVIPDLEAEEVSDDEGNGTTNRRGTSTTKPSCRAIEPVGSGPDATGRILARSAGSSRGRFQHAVGDRVHDSDPPRHRIRPQQHAGVDHGRNEASTAGRRRSQNVLPRQPSCFALVTGSMIRWTDRNTTPKAMAAPVVPRWGQPLDQQPGDERVTIPPASTSGA